jgi:hypothetical protein
MGSTTGRWMDLKEAAETLGVTSEAVRKRVRRGTLASEKHEDGRVLVWVDAGPDTGSDGGYDERVGHGYDELLAEVRGRVRFLEKQLDEEREANRENRRIIAGLVQRVPELEPAREAPPEPRESPETASEPPHSTHASSEPQETSQRRSWWRAFFGLE